MMSELNNNNNEEVVVDFEETVNFIFNKLNDNNVTVPKEIISLVLEFETDYLVELGIINVNE